MVGQPGWTGVGGPLRAGTRIWWITATGGGTPILGLVAGHPVAATTVDIYDATADVWTAAVPVSSIADLARDWREWIAGYGGDTRAAFEAAGIGQEVFFGADIDGAIGGLSVIRRADLGHSPGADHELYATWGPGRGLPEIRTAGDLLAWLLARSGWTVDQGRTIAACRALSHEVAGAVEDADTTVEQYVQDVVLPVLPATLARGPAGVYPVVLSAETLDADPVFALVAGEDCEAIGAVAAEDLTGPRAVRVSYGWDGRAREYQGLAQAGTLPGSGSVVRSTTLGSRQLATRGAGGIEDRMTLMYSFGVATGRITLQQFVDVTSTQAAKIFNMYPRKGAIVPGADADLCIYDPTGTSRISAKTHHQNVDRNIFEGFETKGKVATTVVAGRVQWHDGDLRVERGAGKYIKRTGG